MFVLRKCCCFLLALVASPALAFSPAPLTSYTITTENGQYIFVMISPNPIRSDENPSRANDPAENRSLREKYKHTGLYRNDGATTPLWTLEKYFDKSSLIVHDDGIHLVFTGAGDLLRHVKDAYFPPVQDAAVCFFARGQLIRDYKLRDVLDDPEKLMTGYVPRYSWKDSSEMIGEYEYCLTTREHARIVFDIRTGRIVSDSRRKIRWTWLLGSLGVLGCAVVVRWILKKPTHSPSLDTKNSES